MKWKVKWSEINFFRRFVFAVMMSAVTAGGAIFFTIWINYGFIDGFFHMWLMIFRVAFVVVVLSILFVAPRIQKLVDRIFK